MKVVAPTRKWLYRVLPVLFLCIFAVCPSGQAFAQGPAAQYIGVDAYNNPTWFQTGTPLSTYYVGSPRSEKFFYNATDGLPSNDADTTSNGVPGCGAKNSDGSYVYPTSMLCIITYDNGEFNLTSFLQSTLSDPHKIILAFCNEPDNGTSDHGCVCYLSSYFGPCMDTASNPNVNYFLSEFDGQSQQVQDFETSNNASNVKFGEVSWAGHYNSGDCSYIAPPQYVSYYLVDVYENNLSAPQSLGDDTAWTNWVNCTKNNFGVTRGISEYGIDCGSEQNNDMVVAQTYRDDDTYLQQKFPNLEVWNLWDSGHCAIDRGTGDEPNAVGAWENIEAGN